MNRAMILMLMLACCVVAGCATNRPSVPDEILFADAVDPLVSEEVRDRLMPVASQLARQRYNAQSYRKRFVRSFFEGYEHGVMETGRTFIIDGGHNAEQFGFDAGEAHWRDARAFTPQDFGYEQVEAAGRIYDRGICPPAFFEDSSAVGWCVVFRRASSDLTVEDMLKLRTGLRPLGAAVCRVIGWRKPIPPNEIPGYPDVGDFMVDRVLSFMPIEGDTYREYYERLARWVETMEVESDLYDR